NQRLTGRQPKITNNTSMQRNKRTKGTKNLNTAHSSASTLGVTVFIFHTASCEQGRIVGTQLRHKESNLAYVVIFSGLIDYHGRK
ncbi:MAG: hypothetical protein ACRCWC_11590, partial [Plesiomonas shigelloides]